MITRTAIVMTSRSIISVSQVQGQHDYMNKIDRGRTKPHHRRIMLCLF